VQTEREAEARRVVTRGQLDSIVRDALDAGVTADEVAKIVLRVLRERGLLASAGAIVTEARTARKK